MSWTRRLVLLVWRRLLPGSNRGVAVTRGELRHILEVAGFRSDMYSLTGGLPNEAHCLEDRGREWAVYYSERGQRNEERTFANESDACEFFLGRIRSDPTAKPRR